MSRRTVTGVPYSDFPFYFDSLKVVTNGGVPFFVQREVFETKLRKVVTSEHIFNQIKFESWCPTSIQGTHWVDAFIKATWNDSMNCVSLESILVHDTLFTQDGLFSKIVSEWMAISGFQETADCVRICQLLPKESERPWNLWLSLSLSLVDKKNSNSGYGFRYFCSWLMAVIARTFKKDNFGMYRILKDEVHVSLLTGEKVFLDSLDNRGSFENAVLTMIPERIVKLCPGMKQTQKSYQPSDDLEFEPFAVENVTASEGFYNLERLQDVQSSSLSIFEKEVKMKDILDRFQQKLTSAKEETDRMLTERSAIMSLYQPCKEECKRSYTYEEGSGKLLNAFKKVGGTIPTCEKIVRLKNTLNRRLAEFTFTPGTRVIISRKLNPDPLVDSNGSSNAKEVTSERPLDVVNLTFNTLKVDDASKMTTLHQPSLQKENICQLNEKEPGARTIASVQEEMDDIDRQMDVVRMDLQRISSFFPQPVVQHVQVHQEELAPNYRVQEQEPAPGHGGQDTNDDNLYQPEDFGPAPTLDRQSWEKQYLAAQKWYEKEFKK